MKESQCVFMMLRNGSFSVIFDKERRLEFWKFWEIGLFHEAIFEICWYNFEKSDCGDTWSASFLCKTGPFFCFLWLSWRKEKDKWDFGKKFEKFLQSQRAGLLKRAMKALKRVGLGPSRQAYFGKRRLKMKEKIADFG